MIRMRGKRAWPTMALAAAVPLIPCLACLTPGQPGPAAPGTTAARCQPARPPAGNAIAFPEPGIAADSAHGIPGAPNAACAGPANSGRG